jgi:hypothetical protein
MAVARRMQPARPNLWMPWRALGCSTGTVKSQAARGLQTLRELLGQSITVDNRDTA